MWATPPRKKTNRNLKNWKLRLWPLFPRKNGTRGTGDARRWIRKGKDFRLEEQAGVSHSAAGFQSKERSVRRQAA